MTLLPVNTSCAWLTAAAFRPELVPEELMHPQLTLTVEEYVQGMSLLVNDVRFTAFNVCYKRVVFFWISCGFLFLMSLLFSGARGVSLFAGGSLWLMMNAVGVFACIYFKFKLQQSLERCVSCVNRLFLRHKLLMGVDDRGTLSCHKINLLFLYFDTSLCVRYLDSLLASAAGADSRSASGLTGSSHPSLDITHIEVEDDVVIITSAGDSSRPAERVDRSEGRGERLLLRYSQRWVKDFVRRRLDLKVRLHLESAASSGNWTELPPRHCIGSRCPCQYIEEHLRFKPLSRLSFRDFLC